LDVLRIIDRFISALYGKAEDRFIVRIILLNVRPASDQLSQ